MFQFIAIIKITLEISPHVKGKVCKYFLLLPNGYGLESDVCRLKSVEEMG